MIYSNFLDLVFFLQFSKFLSNFTMESTLLAACFAARKDSYQFFSENIIIYISLETPKRKANYRFDESP